MAARELLTESSAFRGYTRVQCPESTCSFTRQFVETDHTVGTANVEAEKARRLRYLRAQHLAGKHVDY
jgi:hypothetical protein